MRKLLLLYEIANRIQLLIVKLLMLYILDCSSSNPIFTDLFSRTRLSPTMVKVQGDGWRLVKGSLSTGKP